MAREAIFPESRQALYDMNGYSAAIRTGDLLFVSGQVGSLADGSPEPDIDKQIGLAFANLGAVLEAAGCTFDDVVDVTTFHIDPEQHTAKMFPYKERAFPDRPYPNWTAVGVTWLSGFVLEIKAVARIPERTNG